MNVSLCQLLRRKISKNGLQSLANYSRKRNATGNNGAYKIVKSESNIDGMSPNSPLFFYVIQTRSVIASCYIYFDRCWKFKSSE